MSDFWKRKMKTYFRVLDFVNDGVVSKKDYNLMVEESCTAVKDDPALQDKIRKVQEDHWLLFTGSTKTNEKRFMTEAIMIDSLLKLRNDPKLTADTLDICQIFFETYDTNKDGYIDLPEFRRAYSITGLPDPSFAEKAFEVIDTNHRGKFSLDEFTRANLEFILSDDEHSPFNLYWVSSE